MKLLDSCVWMEVIAGSALGLRFKKLATDKQNILISSLVQFEVRRWALRELTESCADDVVTALREVIFVQTTEPIALLAADLARQHKLHAIDALIYATALGHNAQLVTCDAHFKDLPQVDYTAKAGSA